MSRERKEFVSFYPPTHEALEPSVRILSTLRNLTAPGRGNELKQEEVPALIGIAAILGGEEAQSRDTPTEESASRASSCTKRLFSNALKKCRALLASHSASPSPSRASSRSRRGSFHQSDSGDGGGGGGMTTEQVMHLITPRKARKTSDFSLSDAMQRTRSGHRHEPTQSSPLRQSVTRVPSGVTGPAGEATPAAGEKTPTKVAKFHTPRGIDLEHLPIPAVLSSKRKRDTDAFMALRPGSTTPTTASAQAEARFRGVDTEDGIGHEPEWPWLHRPKEASLKKKAAARKEKGVKRRKVDWAYKEGSEWEDSLDLDVIFDQIPGWLDQAKGHEETLAEDDRA